MLLTIISFLLVLTVLVLVHEVGHFLTAKLFGIKVEEFGFGFPPRAWGKKIGETIYSLNWLPIGGFVKLYGEDEAGGGKPQLPSPTKQDISDLQRAFFTHSVWQRAIIVFAGVAMNFILAAGILTYLVAAQGIPTPGKDVYVVLVAKDSPAAQKGITKGDKIISVNGITLTSPDTLITFTKQHEGQSITLIVTTARGIKQTISLIPRKTYPKNEGPMGVAIATNVKIGRAHV